MIDHGELYDELVESGREALVLHPGADLQEWKQILIEQYYEDIVDAIGYDDDEIDAGLDDIWNVIPK